MKIKIFACCAGLALFAFLCSTSFAETIYLRDGRVLKEKIIERGSYYIITEVGKVPHKYFTGQIDRIEEDGPEDMVDVTHIDVMQFEEMGISAEKAKLIVAFMEASGVRRNMAHNMKQVLARAPEERKDELEELFNVDEIIERLIPVYDKHYFEEDLRGAILFYESPAGQKVLKVTPLIMKESVGVSVEYFKEKMVP